MDTLALTYWQRRRLEQQLRSAHDARVYRRTLAVLEVASGEHAGSVARRLRVSTRSVYNWVAAYAQDHDPDSLHDRDRPGRPTLLTDPDRDLIRELIGRCPQEVGYPFATWTVPLLRQHLAHNDVLLSEDTLRREMQPLRYSWKPPVPPRPRPGVRGEKRCVSADASSSCRAGAWCWPRTRPTCCCSRRCDPVGRP